MRLALKREEEIVRLYQGGRNGHEIERMLGCGSTTVYRVLRRHGVAPRSLDISNRRYPVNDSFLSEITTPEQCWLVGLLASDGNVAKRGNGIHLGFKATDAECLETVAGLIGFGGPIHYYDQPVGVRLPQGTLSKGGKRAQIRWCSEQMKADLVRLGITPNKSLTLRLPEFPEHLRPALFRGVIDGDGWVCRHYRRGATRPTWVIGLCGTLATVESFAAFASSITGLNPKLDKRVDSSIWYVRFCGNESLRPLASALYANATCYLGRKKAVADEFLATPVEPSRWAHLTKDGLEDLYAELGDWAAVARHVGIDKPWLVQVRKRLGIPLVERHDWTNWTQEELSALKAEHGSYSAAARFLGVSPTRLLNARHHAGMTIGESHWFGMTLERLDDLKVQYGTWVRVAASLDTTRECLKNLRKRLLARR